MTRLRQRMLEELQRRNYSRSTVRCYLRTVDFGGAEHALGYLGRYSHHVTISNHRSCGASCCIYYPGFVRIHYFGSLAEATLLPLCRQLIPATTPSGLLVLRDSGLLVLRDSGLLVLRDPAHHPSRKDTGRAVGREVGLPRRR